MKRRKRLVVGELVRLPYKHRTISGWHGKARIWEITPGVLWLLPEGVEYDGPMTLKTVCEDQVSRVRNA